MSTYRLQSPILSWPIFAIFVAFFFGWWGGGQDLVKAGRLRKEGVKAEAQITSVKGSDALNYATAHYQFSISDATKYGYSHISDALAAKLAAGAKVNFVYLPSDPEQSAVDLDAMESSGKRAIVIAAVLELLVAAIFIPIIFMKPKPGWQPNRQLTMGPGESVAATVILSVMLVGGFCGLFFSAVPSYMKANQLAAFSKTAVANIDGVYSRSKGKGRYAEYTFQVNGRYFHGEADYRGSYSDRGPLNIHYLPSDPSYSATDPAAKLGGMKAAVIFMIVWNVAVWAFAVALWIKRYRRRVST